MAPLCKAVRTRRVADGVYEGWSGTRVGSSADFRHRLRRSGVDRWRGYALGIACDAVMQHQASTSAPDIVHLSSHFLLPSIADKPVRVSIRTVRAGKRFSNLAVEMEQDGKLTLTLAVVCSTLPEIPDAQSYTAQEMTLAPPSSFARRCPFSAPPKAMDVTPYGRAYTFAKTTRWREDPAMLSRLERLAEERENETEGQRLEWGAWFELLEEPEPINATMLPFIVDLLKSPTQLLADLHHDNDPNKQKGDAFYYPTLQLSMQFFARLPKDDERFSTNCMGLFAHGNAINKGQHDANSELWLAPSNASGEKAGWKQESRLIASASQLALTTDWARNARAAASKL